MSSNLIDEMSEREAKALLNDICSAFQIGGQARTASTILTNVKNAKRRSSCLSLIEHYHTISVKDDDGEECDEQLLNWGESPDEYIETYKAALSA